MHVIIYVSINAVICIKHIPDWVWASWAQIKLNYLLSFFTKQFSFGNVKLSVKNNMKLQTNHILCRMYCHQLSFPLYFFSIFQLLVMRLFDAFPYLFLFSTIIAGVMGHVLEWSLDTKWTLISYSHALKSHP